MRIYQKLRNLTLILLLTVFGQAFGANCEANTTWGGFTIEVATDADKDGFYEIDSPEKLAWFSCYVNKVKKDTKAILTKSIDMEKKWFVPIGSGTNVPGFKGTFNGQNFEISNLSLKTDSLRSYDATKAYAQNVAFVGILDGGTVQNLVLKDVDIQAAVATGESGLAGSSSPISVGAVVAWQSSGKVENCVVSGSITTSGAKNRVGGVVGNVKNATIINCISNVSIVATGAETYVGGVVGALRNGGTVTIESCVYSGDNLYTLNGNVGAIAGNYENVGSLTADNLFYSGNYDGVGVLPANVEFETQYKDNLNTEEVACLLNGNTWSEGDVCEGNHSEVWSVGQTNPSLNGSDGYKIKFDANGGFFSGEKLELSKLVAKGALITGEGITVPMQEGKMFAGWSTDKNAGEPEDELGLSDKEKTIYAVWYDYYKVIFKAGSEEYFSEATFPDGKTKKYEIMVAKHGVVSTNEFDVPTIYEIEDDLGNVTKFYFTGWSTISQDALEENDNVAEHTVDLTSINITEETTLYAVWTKVITYRVTFNASLYGYNVIQFVKHVDQGQTAVRPTEVITKSGYKVVDWCSDESCSNGVYSFNQVLTKDITLFAKWELVPYTITYKHLNAITGEVIDNVSNPEGNLNSCTVETNAFNLATPEKNGYTFDGWYYDDKFGDVANRIDPSGLSDDKTIYAKWIPITYTIQYLSGIYISSTVDPDIKDHDQQDFHLKGSVDAFAISGCSQDGWSLTDLGQKDYELGALYEGNSSLKLYPHWDCPVYNVSYETNGGVNNSMNITKYTGHSKIALLPATYDGFHFGGWYKEIALKNKIENIENINNDITVYAKWNNEIVYNPGSALNGTSAAEDKQLKAKDAKITLKKSINNYVRDHYKLDGWAVEDGKQKVYALGFSYTANEDLLLYPYWKPVEYTATYDLNEGSMDADLSFKYTIESANIVLSVPSREGYDFVGWLDSETGEVITELPQGSYGDRTLTAQWTLKTYIITYNAGEGEGNVAPDTKTHGVDIALSSETFTRTGYTQDGWENVNGDVVSSPYTENADITLYPHWVINTYTITYVLEEGASNDNDNPASYTVETDAFTLKDAVKNGYTFEGWFNGEGEKVTTVAGGATGNLELTAQFTIETYTITYHNVEGATFETSNPETYTVEDEFPIVLNEPTKVGFNFLGWFLSEDAEVPVDGIAAGSTGEAHFYAKWSQITYTITYNAGENGSGEIASGVKAYDVDFTLSNEVFTRDGYTQDGWMIAEDGEAVKYPLGGTYTDNAALDLYPHWTLATYTITYNLDGGVNNGANPASYTIEDLDITLQDPTKEGYEFLCWSTGDDCNSSIETIYTSAAASITVYAKWNKVYPFLVQDFGAIKVYENSDGSKTAKINGNSTEAVNISSDVVVDHVEFVRSFTVGINSTIMLPFSIDTTKISGGSFKEFAYVDESIPKALFYEDVENGIIRANTPYIFIPSSDTLIFNLGEKETVTLNTNDIVVPASKQSVDGGKWQFRGVYSRQTWATGDRQVWGYVANGNPDPTKVGKFLRAGAGAYINPFRAYLYNTQQDDKSSTQSKARRLLAKSSIETAAIGEDSGSSSMEVEFIERETEETTIIGRFNPSSGVIRAIDHRFDMKGRRLDAKPTSKGIYYFNGKQVMVR